MAKPLPKLFIGSSTEAKAIVNVVVQILSDRAACIPWYNAPEFKHGGSFSTLNALCGATDLYDFAIFVLSDDDKLNSRKKRYASPRDNVIFEMGLFLGNLGPERVLGIVRKPQKALKIPSDLEGINLPRFEFDLENDHSNIGSLSATLGGFANAISKKGYRDIDRALAVGWGFDWPTRTVRVKLGANDLQEAKLIIGQSCLAIAARIESHAFNFEDDPNVRFSPKKPLPEPITDMVFVIEESALASTVAEGELLQSRVLLVPPGLDLKTCSTLQMAKSKGCRIVEPLSSTVSKSS